MSADWPNVTAVSHPLVTHSLTMLRDAATGIADFRRHADIVSTIVIAEATRHLELEPLQIRTPLTEMQGAQLRDHVVVVPVLRAGLAMLKSAQEMLDHAPVGFVGLERDEKTAVAREYYKRIPDVGQDHQILILDPMLATGGSIDDTINAVRERGAVRITLACIVSAPEGIERVMTNHPDVHLFTGAIDDHLDERKFIVPGLGDFGDRYFGTV